MDTPYEALSPDKVLTILEGEGYVLDAQLMALNSYENRVYQIGQCDGPPLIAKFYRPGRWSDAALLEEHAFTAELAERDIPAVVPLANGAGETLRISEEGLRFALYPRIAGRAPDLEDDEALAVLGRLLGRIHAVGALEPFEHRPALTVASFGHNSRGFLLETGRLPYSLESAYETLSADLLALIEERFAACAPETVRLHGDCHLGNLLWQEGVAHFVDFDDARQGPAVQDLWLFTSGDVTEQGPQLGKLLTGYERFHAFDRRTLTLLEPLRTLRILHHAAWIGRRWEDPAFPRAFPDYGTDRYWSQHILTLREQLAALQDPLPEVP